MLDIIRDSALRGPKAIIWTEMGENCYPNLSVDRNWWIFTSMFQSCGKTIFKPCIFLRRIQTGNKDLAYLHTIALPYFP